MDDALSNIGVAIAKRDALKFLDDYTPEMREIFLRTTGLCSKTPGAAMAPPPAPHHIELLPET